jgi:hypothetical protein
MQGTPTSVEEARHPDLASAVRDGLLTGGRAAPSGVVKRGDLRRDLGIDLALGGAISDRLLVTGAAIEQGPAEGIVDLVLRRFAPTHRRVPAGPDPEERRSA